MPNPYVVKTPLDAFFTFPFKGGPKIGILSRLIKERRIRRMAVQEIVDLGVLLKDMVDDPRYRSAFSRWSHRTHELEHPANLSTQEDMRTYYDFLLDFVRPTVGELVAARLNPDYASR